jgi:hypothetical protein
MTSISVGICLRHLSESKVVELQDSWLCVCLRRYFQKTCVAKISIISSKISAINCVMSVALRTVEEMDVAQFICF